MSSSLRDQLLKAGLVTEAQARQAEHQQRRQQRSRTEPNAGAKLAAQQASAANAAKAARDQELSRRQQEKADRKARLAQIAQLVEQARVPKVESDDFYSFVDDKKIRRIAVTAALREQLSKGELAIARHKGHYALIPAETAVRIRERDEHVLVPLNNTQSNLPADDPYKDFAVPDDLMW